MSFLACLIVTQVCLFGVLNMVKGKSVPQQAEVAQGVPGG